MRCWIRAVGGMLALACGVCAADPVLDFVYPAGGVAGGEFEVEVGGSSLEGIVQAVVSGAGVKSTFVGAVRETVLNKKGRPVVEVVPNRFRFKLAVEKDAAPGFREFRVATAYRLSEALRFEVAAGAEMSEALTNRVGQGSAAAGAWPVCLNGRVHGAAGDRYTFPAKKGMTVVAFTEAQALPHGGFRPALGFTDAAGKACEGVTVYDAATAPVAVFEVPEDGEYALAVTSATGVTGDATVYRVKLGELPLVTGFAPKGAREGESLNVRLAGHNLAQRRVRLFTGGKNSAMCLATLSEGAYVLPSLRFDLAPEEETAEREPNDTPETAQAVPVPTVVSGVLDEAGGRDVFRFTAEAEGTVYVDVRAAALGSPLRPVVTVRDGKGEVVARGAFDTRPTERAALLPRDPSVAVRAEAGGAYTVEVADAEGRSGEAFAYRMRVGPPQPDFRVWMSPSSLNVPADGSTLVRLFVERVHGFAGPVSAGLDFPPLSIACEGGLVPAGADTWLMTVSTDGVRYPRTVFDLSLSATAEIDGRQVKRGVVPVRFDGAAEAVSARSFEGLAAKAMPGLRALRVDLAGKSAVTLAAKGTTTLTVLSPNMATHLGGQYQPVVVWPPAGLSVQGVQLTNRQERALVQVAVDPKVFRAGDAGRFILGCVQKADTNRTVMAVTQSVPFTVK